MIRLGLCCIFREVPIKFRTTTVKALSTLPRRKQLEVLNELCLHNASALMDAILWCAENGIGAFRINSKILPVKTHPAVGYSLDELPDGENILKRFEDIGRVRKEKGMRLSFHPDQFVLLNSPRIDVVEASLQELAYQSEVAEWVGADVVNIHGGGAYGNKSDALIRLQEMLMGLPEFIRSKLTLENDDRIFSPHDLLPVCNLTGIPMVYDVHHHRCLADELSIEEATEAAVATWSREPLFHISSPRNGWADGVDPKPHHDFIDPQDFPTCWEHVDMTLDVEAKAKEPAVQQVSFELMKRNVELWSH